MEKSVSEYVQYLIGEAIKTDQTQRTTSLQFLSEAFALTKTIDDISIKLKCLDEIARACEKLNLVEIYIDTLNQAFEIAQTIVCNSARQRELAPIGNGYIQALHLANFLEVQEEFDKQDLNLDTIANACREIEDSCIKLEIADLLENDTVRLQLLEPLVQNSIVSGRYDQLIEFIENSSALDAGDVGYGTLWWLIPGIVEYCVNLGADEHLLQLVVYVGDPEIKILLLGNLAKSYLTLRHDQEMFLDLLNQAYITAETIEDKYSRAFAKDMIDSIRVKDQCRETLSSP